MLKVGEKSTIQIVFHLYPRTNRKRLNNLLSFGGIKAIYVKECRRPKNEILITPGRINYQKKLRYSL